MVPGPFARADFRGLDDVLAALERGEAAWGEAFAPPITLRRLVARYRHRIGRTDSHARQAGNALLCVYDEVQVTGPGGGRGNPSAI